jgi:ubiquinone/menaquinone biosynthesis C-methylase UbiE
MFNKLRKRFLARFIFINQGSEGLIAPWKRRLLSDLNGTILEIGPGTGANLNYLPIDIAFIGVDPNHYMFPRFRNEAQRLGRNGQLLSGSAMQLPLKDGSVDAVICSYVLCSVNDAHSTLQEIRRVLKPGGHFIFVEHVAASSGTWLRHVQNALRPLWGVLGDGCHPNRETLVAIQQAGFRHVDAETFHLPLPIVGPHIAGKASK